MLITVLLIGSLVPIWRRAGVDRPLNAWELLATAAKQPVEHIHVEEAIARAREAGYLKGFSNTRPAREFPTRLEMRA